MDLTIAELSRATGKSGNYLRQHIHREHLKAHRKGRRVYVSTEEAVRWARERGLSLDLPAHNVVRSAHRRDRTARLTVLTLLGSKSEPQNLFTMLRHRRSDTLGPWAGEPERTWLSSDIGDELRLFTFDAPLACCQELVDKILESGKLEINDVTIHYDLEPRPRCHWAYRDDRSPDDPSVCSPFSRHSAEIVEYWSFVQEVRERWLEMHKTQDGKLESRLKSMPFPLVRRPDRAGNLMIAGAQDGITCNLATNSNRSLDFHVDAPGMLPDTYRATVWASHSGDEVLRREVSVAHGRTEINLNSDVDHIGFAVYRTVDGQCIDLMDVNLVLQVDIQMRVDAGRTLRHQVRQGLPTHAVNLPGDHSSIRVESDHDGSGLDKGIRRHWLERKVYVQETALRREGNFARFGPDEFDKATSHFIGLISRFSEEKDPIYLADPYFMTPAAGSRCTRLYLDLFASTMDRELRILCAPKTIGKIPPWWSTYREEITDHFKVRAFQKHDGSPGFHDRFLITSARETLITHSLNGWSKDGVTFANLPYKIYLDEAERLWSMNIQSTATGLFVWKIW